MEKEFITTNSEETKKLGEDLAKNLKGGEIICLQGDLGSGKTTFTQGLLKGLGVSGPYTSPTFVIMKHYHITHNMEHITKAGQKDLSHVSCPMLHDVYHLDAYRVGSEDILSLGWEEMINDKNNVIIVEWAERIVDIIPFRARWIRFQWVDENKRKIKIQKSKFKSSSQNSKI